MPLYEYTCEKCGDHFELLVTTSTQPTCPRCGANELRKHFSTFSASGTTSPSSGHVHTGSCGCGRPQGGCGGLN